MDIFFSDIHCPEKVQRLTLRRMPRDIYRFKEREGYAIEHQQKKLTCRVYTEYRSTAVAGSLWSPTALLGAVSAAAIGVHNLATWNPDYEIGKNYVKRTLSVRYKK
ncbi:hypothetical protein BB790_24825 [Klebsiella pneumoniae]|nr:hypothetical protein BB790_24825 [Klebsiella pneumoniae]